MTSSMLKRKSIDDGLDRPAKSAKLEITTPSLSGRLPQFTEDVDMMDVDMDMEALSPASTDSSPSTTPSSVLPAYPNLQIYTPLNPIASDTAPSTLFDSRLLAQHQQSRESAQLLKPLVSPTSTCSCERIPKLTLACAKPNGNRSLWSFCDGCGAIGIVA